VVGRQPDVGNRRYYYFDLLGSTRAVVEGSTVVESYDFDPWGLLMPGRALGSGTKEGFTGKEQDGASGLDYFGARYYLPALGRWGAVDPLADGFPGWSPYNYAVDNPVGYTDPTGMAACDVADSKCLERVQSAIRHGLGPWWPRYPDVDAPLMAQEAGRCPPNCPPGPDEEHATDIPATTRTEMGGCIVALVLCNNAGYRYTWGGLAHFLLGTNLSRQQQADALAFDLANPIHFGGGMLARLGVRTGARKALIRRTGIELADAHAHHVFPVRFLEDFAARGVDISNSRYLAWWQATDHLSNARGYNRHWEQWFARHPNASPGSVVEFGRKLARFYGVHVDF
jgi:RHS repeat-associated protein